MMRLNVISILALLMSFTAIKAQDDNKTIVLKSNVKHGVSLLSHDMMYKEGAKYVIQWDYDLGGETVEVPENCILEFDGGSLRNGHLVGNNTKIINNSDAFIFNNVEISGNIKNDYLVGDWFINDPEHADTGINNAVSSAYLTKTYEVRLMNDHYSIYNPIKLYNMCRLIGKGEIRTPSRGNYSDICSVTYITVRANVDGIVVTPYQYNSEGGEGQFSLNSVAIKNVFICGNTKNSKKIHFDNTIKSNYGIHIYNIHGEYPITFRNSNFQNVGVNNFRYGIFIDNCGYYPSGSAEWRKVVCSNNHIGLVIRGKGKDADNGSHGVWTNCFLISSCIFANNYLGGVYIDNIPQTELVKFSDCVFEGNGNNYNLSMIKDINEHPLGIDNEQIGAYAIRCQTGTNYGQIILDNCYIELNYFRKKGNVAVKDEEKVYVNGNNSYVSPTNVMKNSYMIYSSRQPVIITKCRINNQIKLAYICSARFRMYDNFVTYALPSPIKTDRDLFEKDNYLVYYNFGNNPWYDEIRIEDVFDLESSDKKNVFDYVTQFVKSNTLLLSKCKSLGIMPDIHLNVPHEPPLHVRKNQYIGDFYINKDRKESSICTYFAEGKTLSEVDELIDFLDPHQEGTIYRVYYKKSSFDNDLHDIDDSFVCSHRCGFHIMPYNFPDDYYDASNNIILPTLIHQAGKTPKKIYNNLTIDYFHISSQGQVSTPSINVLNGSLVEFNNCKINFGSGKYPLITTKINNLTIRFNNCYLYMTNLSQGDVMHVTDNIHNVVEYNNCKAAENVRVLNYNKSGHVSERPLFNNELGVGYEFFDVSFNKPFYWNGKAWVDSNGITDNISKGTR